MTNFHYTKAYLLNPQHKVTVHLVGIGGTGSQVLSGLARIHKCLQAFNHPGIHVRAFDPDKVTVANIGRQMFSEADLNLNKAACAVTRINRFFGYNWEAYDELYDVKKHPANIIVTCVDTAKTRIDIAKSIAGSDKKTEPLNKLMYWLDFGNLKTTGQVVLGTIGSKNPLTAISDEAGKINNNIQDLPCVNDLFNLEEIKEKDQGPSCSLAEALGKQSLFINSTLANLGCDLLLKLFLDGKIDYHGIYLNLKNSKTNPIMIEGCVNELS